jgi:hypothetical protein
LAQGIAPPSRYSITSSARSRRRRHIDTDCSDAKRPLRLLTRTDTSGLMLWFFLLVLVLGLVFGWHVAAVLLVLWLIGYVGFWLFMLCKPVKGDY